ncbi:hypothetical protein VTK26DRAFT_766 [Humicola hyalothermophila]
MSTTGAQNQTQDPASDLYDPDEVLPRNSPLLEPYRPTLQPTPSPVPSLSSPVSPPPSPGRRRSKRRIKARQGDVILISHLDGHRRDTATYAADIYPLTSETDDTDGPDLPEDSGSPDQVSPGGHRNGGGNDPQSSSKPGQEKTRMERMSPGSPENEDVGAFDLKSLAAGALAAVTEPHPRASNAGAAPPGSENNVVGGRTQAAPTMSAGRSDSSNEDHTPATVPSPYSPRSLYSPRDPSATPLSLKMDQKSPSANTPSSSHSDGLPPLQLNSPRFETNGQTLPSIRTQLGDIQQLAGNGPRTSHHSFPGSPPANIPRLPSLHGHLASPPVPSADLYRDPLSPGRPLAPPALSPGYYIPHANGVQRPHDYASSSTATPGSDHSAPTPAASADRMSIDGITVTGNYVCKFAGCTAPPFQTQYLLNSHANVHSSARPHYCPVPGCPRSEGGKGFKRKNEMIRHGLVHDSPGYVCPFCPDREHKYPRPDNLQRHVRVHHVDKDKDDPLLRDVLSQRPDGPNRGRRRRGAAS